MTIARKLPNRTVWKCDICGNEDIWQESWGVFGSLLMEEEAPEDLLTVCSDECKEVAEKKLKEGSIKLPTYKMNGLSRIKITGKRIGY